MWVLLDDAQVCVKNFFDVYGKLVDYTRNETKCTSFPKYEPDVQEEVDYTTTIIASVAIVSIVIIVLAMMTVIAMLLKTRRGRAIIGPSVPKMLGTHEEAAALLNAASLIDARSNDDIDKELATINKGHVVKFNVELDQVDLAGSSTSV